MFQEYVIRVRLDDLQDLEEVKAKLESLGGTVISIEPRYGTPIDQWIERTSVGVMVTPEGAAEIISQSLRLSSRLLILDLARRVRGSLQNVVDGKGDEAWLPDVRTQGRINLTAYAACRTRPGFKRHCRLTETQQGYLSSLVDLCRRYGLV